MSEFDLEKYKSIGFVGTRMVQGRFVREKEKKWDRDLEAYSEARKEGIQPDSTERGAVELAKAWSDEHGTPWRGDNLTDTAKRGGYVDKVEPYTPAQGEQIREEILSRRG